MVDNLTRVERSGLSLPLQFADAHPRRPPVAGEARILSDLDRILRLCYELDPIELERRFVNSHLALAGQQPPPSAQAHVYFSASQAIEVAAQLVATRQAQRQQHSRSQRRQTLAVFAPIFDSIPAQFHERNIRVMALPEALLHRPSQRLELERALRYVDAVYIISPSNPLGGVVGRERLAYLAALCASRQQLLIVDASFRLYDPAAGYDHYSVLNASRADWLVVEDTGKLWAAHDLKAAILLSSWQLEAAATAAFETRLLSISPFVLALLWQLAETAGAQAVEDIRRFIAANRQLVADSVAGTWLSIGGTEGAQVPVAVLHYDRKRFSDQTSLLAQVKARGLGLTGSQLYYPPERRSRSSLVALPPFLRLALSRPPERLYAALELLRAFPDD